MKNYLSETEGIIVGLFCAPPHGSNGNPNYMTEENYRALKEAGVDLIMGNNEIFSTPEEGYAFASIALCEKTGLKYFAYDDLSGYFYSIGKLCPWTKNKKAFWEYSEQEKKDLLERYAKSLERYMKNDTCVGVKFSDEIGWAMLDGIKYAKDYFDKEYPDKIFFINMLGYNVSDAEYMYGMPGAGMPDKATFRLQEMPEVSIEYATKIGRWDIFANKVLDTLDLPVLTQDSYAMEPIGGVNNVVNRCLYDLSSYLATVKKKRGIPVGNFIQDGHWDKSSRGPLTKSEFDLQVNVLVAYGMDMILIYPGCWPTETNCLTGNAGLIDRNGQVSPVCDYMKLANRQLRAVDKDIRSATFVGMMAAGEFKSLQPKDLSGIEWNDAIFVGELPPDTLIDAFAGIREVRATSQCILGCFESETHRMCYIVNNSISFAADCFVSLDGEKEIAYIRDGAEEKIVSDKVEIYGLPAGASAFIKYKK